LAEQAVKENHSHIRYLEALLSIECEARDRHAINNQIRDAQSPRMNPPTYSMPWRARHGRGQSLPGSCWT
jgi:hypothetical protein